MLSEELLKNIEDAEDKARKWDKLSSKYLEVAKILKDGIVSLHLAEECFVKAIGLIDPLTDVKPHKSRSRVSKVSEYVNAQVSKLGSGKEVSMVSLSVDFPELDDSTLKYIMSKLGKVSGVKKHRDSRQVILSMGGVSS